MDPIAVTTRFDEQGQATPLNFTWQGTTYIVESTGRRWQDDSGHHILVMIPSGQFFELLLVPDNLRWYLKQVGPSREVA